MSRDPGKDAEQAAQAYLTRRGLRHAGFAWHRLPDARAARGALASQPSDFLVVNDGTVTFLEVKETKERNRLPRTKITQYGALQKFLWAGALVCVLVYRSAYMDWVVLNQGDLFPEDEQDTPTSFPFTDLKSYPTAEDALESTIK